MQLRVAILFALALSLHAEIPCLDGQGPLQDGQARCEDVTFTSQIEWNPSFLNSIQASYTAIVLQANGDWRESAEKKAKDCRELENCSVMKVYDGDKLIAELDADGQWHLNGDPKDVGAIILWALSGGNR